MLKELEGRKIVVYDLEIENEVDGVNVTWDTKDKMGISCGGAFSYATGDYMLFMKDNMEELVELLNNADLIVAFNQIQFDNPLLRATGYKLKEDSDLKNYDMLVESRKATGWRPGDRFPKGLKLDNHLEGTFGVSFMKGGNGADAPKWWQQKLVGKLLNYQIRDIRVEKGLFEHIWEYGYVRTAEHGQKLLAHPRTFLNEIKSSV